MALAMTEQQERDFDEKGFIVLEDFFERDEVNRLLLARRSGRADSRCRRVEGPD